MAEKGLAGLFRPLKGFAKKLFNSGQKGPLIL
jgi:hypothetical protein